MTYLTKLVVLFMLTLVFIPAAICQQTTEINYQGQLFNNSVPASGSFDFEFILFDNLVSGTQIGSSLTRSGVSVNNGTFNVKLDFGSSFPGANRFIEVRVRQTGAGSYTPLLPRQAITATPYSVKSITADSASSATNATQLGGVAASQYVLTSDTRLTDARNPLPNSSNYIQNRSTIQSSSNFNISGTGIANIFDAGQYNIFGEKVFTVTGDFDTFVGRGAGRLNDPYLGTYNSFFGKEAGAQNTTGGGNSFFGGQSGNFNTVGTDNSFYGSKSGLNNTTGGVNSFFGSGAGVSNSSGQGNAFFGYSAGQSNNIANDNTYVGVRSGKFGTTGANNSFFGSNTGQANSSGSFNTLVGSSADVGSSNLTYATAVGADSIVLTSNTIQLGRNSGLDIINVSGKLMLNVLGTSGTTALCRNLSNEIAVCGTLFDQTANQQILNRLDSQETEIAQLRNLIEQQAKQLDDFKKVVCAINPNLKICSK